MHIITPELAVEHAYPTQLSVGQPCECRDRKAGAGGIPHVGPRFGRRQLRLTRPCTHKSGLFNGASGFAPK